MPILAHRTWALRRALRASHGLLLAGAFAAALLAGVFSRVGGDALPLQAALGLGWVLLFASRAIWRARLPAGHAEAGRLELELGLWALLGAYAIVQRFGGPMGALQPDVAVHAGRPPACTRIDAGVRLVAGCFAAVLVEVGIALGGVIGLVDRLFAAEVEVVTVRRGVGHLWRCHPAPPRDGQRGVVREERELVSHGTEGGRLRQSNRPPSHRC